MSGALMPPSHSRSRYCYSCLSYSFSNNEFYGLFVSKLLSLNHCVLIIVEKKREKKDWNNRLLHVIPITFCYLRSI